jgi:hypothetical protein
MCSLVIFLYLVVPRNIFGLENLPENSAIADDRPDHYFNNNKSWFSPSVVSSLFFSQKKKEAKLEIFLYFQPAPTFFFFSSQNNSFTGPEARAFRDWICRFILSTTSTTQSQTRSCPGGAITKSPSPLCANSNSGSLEMFNLFFLLSTKVL